MFKCQVYYLDFELDLPARLFRREFNGVIRACLRAGKVLKFVILKISQFLERF